ncbi:hypothetical protein D9M69_692090 [compost metagenome]
MWSKFFFTDRSRRLMSTPADHWPGMRGWIRPVSVRQWLSLYGMYNMPVFGLYASYGQSLPPHRLGQ